jgi:DNA (cytosine-5)-methyltransferase 1
MRHGSLFSGIGGFDLAAEWMGWENAFHCEWNAFGQQVLKHYWPNAISDFTVHRGKIDILTGGFPCQPYSTAGKRKGKEDERHLWPEMLRAIREIAPRWVVGENVLGIVSWNEGMVFDEVQAELEAQGYQVQAYVLPACGVNAPHRRDRVWFVAYASSVGQQGQGRAFDTCHKKEDGDRQEHRAFHALRWPTQPPVYHGDDGLSARLDGITLREWRQESIKAGGNAIVPQVAHQIFKAINQYEQDT